MKNGEINPYKPGEAWDAARRIIDKPNLTEADLKEAERLCQFMVLSDAWLMLKKIEAKRSFGVSVLTGDGSHASPVQQVAHQIAAPQSPDTARAGTDSAPVDSSDGAATFGTAALKAGDDCPKCGGELERVIHRYDTDGGAPDCSWLLCLDCNYQTDPE